MRLTLTDGWTQHQLPLPDDPVKLAAALHLWQEQGMASVVIGQQQPIEAVIVALVDMSKEGN